MKAGKIILAIVVGLIIIVGIFWIPRSSNEATVNNENPQVANDTVRTLPLTGIAQTEAQRWESEWSTLGNWDSFMFDRQIEHIHALTTEQKIGEQEATKLVNYVCRLALSKIAEGMYRELGTPNCVREVVDQNYAGIDKVIYQDGSLANTPEVIDLRVNYQMYKDLWDIAKEPLRPNPHFDSATDNWIP